MNDDPRLPIYVTAKDVAIMEDCSQSAAKSRFTLIKKAYNLLRSQKLSWRNYCDFRGITIQEAVQRLLKFILIIISFGIAYACGKRLFDYSCEFFRKHKMHWEKRTPTQIKGHTFIYDQQTKQMEKVTIQVTKIK